MTAAEVMALIRASEKKFYCYVLRRPDGKPFYVGVGTGRRILLHRTRDTRAGSKTSLIQRVLGDGASADYSIAGFYGIREFAVAEEKKLIAHYGRADLGDGPLANCTDGGEGASGIVWRQEILDRRSAALRGRKLSPEHVAAMSAAGKGRDVSAFVEGARRWREENMDKLIAERRGRWDNPGTRERHLKAMAEPAVRSAMAAAMNSRLGDPAKRGELLASVRAARSRQVIAAGSFYCSITAAARALGVANVSITYRIKKGFTGYRWVEQPKI